MKQFDQLRKYCSDNQLKYDEQTEIKFITFCDMLLEKNKVMNLTAVTDPIEIEYKHFIDSLTSAQFIHTIMEKEPLPDRTIIDIGTGAGFPGLPLSFVLPEVRFVLADSLAKRIEFIQEVIDTLALSNAAAIQGRAEELGQNQYRERFQCCVSRAVADTAVLLEYCLPLVRKGGYIILYKSGDYHEELERASHAVSILGGEVSDIKEFSLEGTSIKRSLIIIQKTGTTPEKYPRRAGMPSKKPLVIR